jgi:hypothetical protein
VSSAAPQQQQPLQAQIDEAREKMVGLERALDAVDGELENLAEERQRYELLEQVCGSLEKLGELGAAELFWGQRVEGGKAAEHVHQVRARVDLFRDRLAEIETRRESLLDGIKQEQDVLEILEEDLYEAIEREEQRKAEWVIEREMDAPPDRLQVMPWVRGGEDDARFRKTLAGALLSALLLGLLFPFIDLPLPALPEPMEVQERFARLIRPEERPLPPPPVREEQPIEEPQPEPEPVVAEETPQETPQPTEPPPPAVAQEEPRQRPEQSGILAFRESFANLAENRPAAQLGSQARISTSGDAAAGRPERSMVTSQAPGSSGGINIAALSRDVAGGGGGQIGGVEVGRVESAIGAGGSPDRPTSAGASAGRTDEEIQIVFDRYKAALYRLYNRELRRDPTLRGQMVLRVTIEPNGSVSLARLESATMNAPELAEQVLERVRTFDFGAKDVPPVTILYPIDFLPAV